MYSNFEGTLTILVIFLSLFSFLITFFSIFFFNATKLLSYKAKLVIIPTSILFITFLISIFLFFGFSPESIVALFKFSPGIKNTLESDVLVNNVLANILSDITVFENNSKAFGLDLGV
jgi:hypothetical protein